MIYIASRAAMRSPMNFRRLAASFVGCGVVALTIAAPRVASAQTLKGSFTLTVTPSAAPEPSAFTLALTGGVPVAGLVLRRRA